MAMSLLLQLLAALIQVRGQPLAGGSVNGSAVVPLERAEGGDTPVLSLTSSRGAVRLLLDTGASSSMVTPELVRRLGLGSEALSPASFGFAGGGSDCGELVPRRTRLPALELGASGGPERLQLRGVEALVMPAGALPSGIDGVLGAPTLRRQPFWVDPLGRQLAFGAAALRQAGAGNGKAAAAAGFAAGRATDPDPVWRSRSGSRSDLPLRWHQGVPLVWLRTPLGTVSALADTGAEGLFLSTGLAAQLPSLGEPRRLRLVGFCGEQPVEQRPYTGLSLGPHRAPRPESPAAAAAAVTAAIVIDNPIFQVLGVEAIVGQELLRERRQLWRLDLDPPRLELH